MEKHIEKASEYTDVFIVPLMEVVPQFTSVGMKLLAAIVVYIIGKLIAGIIMKIVKKALEASRVDDMMSKAGITGELKKAGIECTLTGVLNKVIGFILTLVVWMAVINVLGIQQLTDFMNQIINYMPNILVAILLLAVGVTVAKKVQDIIENMANNKASNLGKDMAQKMGKIAKYAILVLTVMASINQLGIGGNMVETLFGGMSFGIALAFGIAFGLGGKDCAAKLMEKACK